MSGRAFTALGAALSAGLVLVLSDVARADELAWKLEGSTLRYDLTVERPAPEPAPAPVFCPLVLLAQADFRDGRTPLRAVEDVGDLVWHYAALLPAGSIDEKGADVTFEAQHVLPGNPAPTLRLRGVHASRLRGRKATIRTTITFSPEPPTFWAKSGQLVVERTFSVREGRLESATFTLDIDVQAGAPLVTTHGTWKGTIASKDELRVDDRSFHQQVQQSIDKGATWLKRAANDRLGAFKGAPVQGHQSLGEIALPTFALLRSGVPVSEVEHLFEWMHRQPFKATYSVSLYLMALEARSVQRTSLAAQNRTRSVARFNRQPPPAADVELMKQALKWLVASRKIKEGWWSYGGRLVEAGTQERREGPLPVGPLGHDLVAAAGGGDRSNSQFAILALHSAMAAGLEVDGAVWEELLDELTGAQQETGPTVDLTPSVYGGNSPLAFDPRDSQSGTTSERPQGGLPPTERANALARGWGYATKSRTSANDAYGSMTAAGLSSVAVVREGLLETRHLTGERDRAALLAMRDGIAWFALNYDPARNVGRNTAWYYYYLYSVEKAMDLCGLERVGAHEWWREGAAELLVRQQPNGSWGDANDTALALLFLNRATLPAKLDIEAARRVATGSGPDPTAWDKVNVVGTGVVSLRQVMQALLNAGPREMTQHLPLAQSAFSAFDEVLRPRLLPELVQLLDASHRNVKKWAKDSCLAVAGTDDPAAIATFTRRWEELRIAWESEDRTKIPVAQAIMVEVDAPVPLKRAALVAVARLGGCETLGEVIALLDHRDAGVRTLAGQTLIAIAGPRREYDANAAPAARKTQVDAWRAWWQSDGPALVTAERVRRAVVNLGVEAKSAAAAQELRAIGRPAVRALIDGLRNEASKAKAHTLLQELTTQKLPADVGPWIEWWEKENPAPQ